MPQRRTHRKSRGGCHECKRRRVKCDERRPHCSNCLKREENCSYPAASFLEWGKDSVKDPGEVKAKRPRTIPSATRDENPFSSLQRLGSTSQASGLITDLNLRQLELMAQWCHATYKALSRNESTDAVWAQYVAEEAVSQPFLMHGILSLSALHLAQLRPENRALYLNLSVAHQDPGLSSFRDQLLQISPANSKAMFAFSSVVVAFAFGYPVIASSTDQTTEVHKPSLEELFRVLMLARGVHNIVQTASESLRESNFAPVLNFEQKGVIMPEDVTNALEELDSLNVQCQVGNPPETLEAYQKAIHTLRNLSFTVYTGGPNLTLPAGWAIRLPAEVMENLQVYEPLSLVILAHYCVFLHAERDHWCLNRWGAAVMRDIWQLLDDNWRPHVQWAMTKIFDTP